MPTSDLRQQLELLIPSVDTDTWSRLGPVVDALGDQPVPVEVARRLAAVSRASRVIPATIASHPDLVRSGPDEISSIFLQQVKALLDIAGDEFSEQRPLSDTTQAYSGFIDSLVASSLTIARDEVSERYPATRTLPFAVIAMGKWGAGELNYSSDIDLMFVHGTDKTDPDQTRPAAFALASRLVANLGATSFDGPGLVVDADLRPEGTMGPLSRRVEAYASYYQRWAEPWELQALIKARAAAGDLELGHEFINLATKVVWEDGLEVDALRGLRRIKADTEVRAHPADIKRAPGGIRDIEFTVQMLQLVHGRHDPTLRVRGTFDALNVLEQGNYISGEETSELREDYHFLRKLEHLIQIWELRQTHRFPDDADARRRISRSMNWQTPEELSQKLLSTRVSARTLHERIYFRPILDTLVGSPSARLGPARASERLTALGFANTRQSTAALDSMTRGLSRKSRAMQQMMPLMLDWLSLSPDPDLGLSQLRTLLANTSDHSSLIGRLLNNPVTGERLAMLLGTGRLFGDIIDRIPEFVPRLANDAALDDIRNREDAAERLTGLLHSRPELDERIGTVRRFARRRRLRIAARDVIRNHDTLDTIRALSDGADVVISGALDVAAPDPDHDFAVIAMGRWGGRELSYGSDLDLMYVFDAMERKQALSIPGRLHEILGAPSRHGEGYELDAGLRPEGKNGPMVRSLESIARYYAEWAEPWEHLALIRGRTVAGNPATCAKFVGISEEALWGRPVDGETVASIRRIKARVENERIGPEEDADFHLKLGPGSLSDIEFLAQLLQLRHGHDHPDLRVHGTVEALQALLEADLISPQDHLALIDSYEFCSRVRLRLHLQKGRLFDSLPASREELSKLSASLGYDRSNELREAYQRVTRRARRIFVARFYE